MATEDKSHGEYTVGWICALPKEQTAAMAMLDEIHPDLDKPPNDHNAYTLGSIGGHNIVVACLPKGKIGTNSAATVATRMIQTFPSIKVGLMVGIGGGIPSHVRLGDVVVSAPVDEYPGVVQWDLGKAEHDGNFKRTGALNNPPSALLTALTKLESSHEMTESKIPQYLDEVERKWPKLAPRYTSSSSLKDPLFASGHGEGEKRKEIRVHYGLIASGNQVIKDSEFRDSLNDSFGGNVLCVEMEAAGLMNDFPCIVIRGICDYADSQKNKNWQEYAAMIAAGCAKELLGYVRPADVHAERPMRDLLRSINTNIENIGSKLERSEERAILEWLSPLDYAPQQNDFINRRQPGTGQWLLDSIEYHTWLGARGQTLFCTGIPGAGKTIISSIVINDLMTRAIGDPTISVAYIYCNFKREDQQKINDLLRSLIRQLLRGLSVVPDFVKAIYERGRQPGTQLSPGDISKILETVLTSYSRVFLIIDALDECQNSDGCRSKLLSKIFGLQVETKLNFFATSRHIPDIEQHFKGCLTQEILASDDDVRKYLDGHMPDLPSFVVQSSQLRESIKNEIVQAAEGMFLLAQLYFDSLKDKTSKREINDILKEFKRRRNREPGSNRKRELLDDAYDEAMERINGQMGGMKRLGRKVIAWITCARWPLRTRELQHGLAVEIGDTDLDEDNIREIEMIRSVCAGLVIVDEESGIIRLVHYTTQEYFDTRQEHLFQNEKVDLMNICLTYLSFNVFGSGFCEEILQLELRLKQNPFYDYAVRNWGHHARDVGIKDEELVLIFLTDDAKASSASQVIMTFNEDFDSRYDSSDNSLMQYEPAYGLGIHIAAWFGLGDVVMALIKGGQDPNAHDTYGRTALACAAEEGHHEVVKLLLAVEGINPNSSGKGMLGRHSRIDQTGEWEGRNPYSERLFRGYWYSDRCGGTPLLYAALNGRDEIVRTLLEDPRVNPNVRDHAFGVTPLWCASGNGHETTVKLLLEKPGIDPDSRDDKGDCMSPLSIAVWRGHTAVVRLLLATEGVDPDSYDTSEQTPLRRAAWKGHDEIFDLLLTDGRIDPNAEDIRGFTPLILAAMEGHEGIIKLLLSKGGNIDFNAADNYVRMSPLHWAARYGKEGVARLLLGDERVDVNRTNTAWGSTALMFAAEEGRVDVVRLLLSAERADPNLGQEAALHLACARNRMEVVMALLNNKRVDPNEKDYSGMTPLMRAVARGNTKMVEILMEFDAVDPNVKTVDGRTPLILATMKRHRPIITMLLDKGADPIARDNLGRSPLFYLAMDEPNGPLERLIMDERVELDLKDCFGSTPLSTAVRFGCEKSAELILATGKVDVNSEDNFGRTPLWWATKKGYLQISNLLLQNAEKNGLSILDMMTDIDVRGCLLGTVSEYYISVYCTICSLAIHHKELCCVCRNCQDGVLNICFYCYNAGARCFNDQHQLEFFNETSTPRSDDGDSS